LRDIFCKKMICSAVSRVSRRASGRLIHQAIAGEAIHKNKIGPATASVAGVDVAR